jgi:hypothetical protein
MPARGYPMSIYKQDEVSIRELRHAFRTSASLRAAHALADAILTAGNAAADELFAAARALLLEIADDDPARAARNDAARALQQGVTGAVEYFRAKVVVATLDEDFAVADRATRRRADALIRTFAPGGRLSDLSQSGERLQRQAQVLRDGLAAFPGMQAVAARLDAKLDAHARALAEVAREAEELVAARQRLTHARAQADRLRSAGWHQVESLAAWMPEQDIDVRRIYPVRNTAAPEEEGLADLEAAGAEPLPDAPA